MGDVRRIDADGAEQDAVTLDDLAREGARRMIATALEAEVSEYVASFTEELGEDGKRLVVRNGRARERRVTVGSGTVGISDVGRGITGERDELIGPLAATGPVLLFGAPSYGWPRFEFGHG